MKYSRINQKNRAMKVFKEMQPSDHEAWSGAVGTLNRIKELNLESDFDSLIEELYPDGIDETQLNDILWFEEDWIFEMLGITEEEEEEEEEDCPAIKKTIDEILTPNGLKIGDKNTKYTKGN